MPASCSPSAALAAWLALCLPAQLFIPPTHQPTFHGSDNVQSFAFAPDRPVLYVNAHAPSVNLWPNIVALWPELLGAVVALATLVFLIFALRVIRRPRRRAVPYCRRCNYDLSAHVRPSTDAKKPRFTWDPAALCPECGAKLDRARPIRGRPLLVRLAPALALWLAIVGPYAAMWAFRLPRAGSANQWLDLSSVWVMEHTDHWAIRWLSPTVADSDHIVEIDLATGRITRAIATRSFISRCSISISPDGAALFLPRGGDALDAISVRTGRVLHSVRFPGTPAVDWQNPAVIGFTPDGAEAYVQWWNLDRNRCGVARWPWRTGGPILPLVESPGFIDVKADGTSCWPRLFLLRDHDGAASAAGRPGEGAPRFLCIPSYVEAYDSGNFVVKLHDGAAEPRSFDVRPGPRPRQGPVFSEDASTLFLIGEYALGLLALNLDSGEVLRVPDSAEFSTEGDRIARSQRGRYLLLGGRREMRLWDTVEKQPIAVLSLLTSYSPCQAIAPDGRWAAAVCQVGVGTAVQQLLIWDLRDHPLVESSSNDAPAPAPAPASPPP